MMGSMTQEFDLFVCVGHDFCNNMITLGAQAIYAAHDVELGLVLVHFPLTFELLNWDFEAGDAFAHVNDVIVGRITDLPWFL